MSDKSAALARRGVAAHVQREGLAGNTPICRNERYRPDIDGLRAVAVLAVILYHSELGLVPGGFVGVDVFFVISGYLITGIISREIDTGAFSIVRFYERRVRRIMPALLAMIAAVVVGTAFFYLPSDFSQVPKSVLATLFFSSNILFYSESTYFGTASQAKPLLHTWSLAVEEQYYIIFPWLLMLIRSYGATLRKVVLWLIAVGSLAASMYLVEVDADFGFYMLPTRAWELMAGALLAVGSVPEMRRLWARQLMAAAGLAAIVAACLLFSSSTPFPGRAALLPVLGSAVLIHTSRDTWVGALLSRKPMVFIGLISYSLYLWHWPILVFLNYAAPAELPVSVTAMTLILIGIAATLCWWFVERPVRSKARVSRRQVFTGAVAACTLLGCVAVTGHMTMGWPSRFDPEALRLAAFARAISPMREKCHHEPGDSIDKPYCTLGANTAPTYAVWGDSHGVELSYALAQRLGARGESLVQYTHSACPPVLEGMEEQSCLECNRRTLQTIKESSSIKTVVIAGRWLTRDEPGFADRLHATTRHLSDAGKRVVFVGAVPDNTKPVPRKLALLASQHRLSEAHGMAVSELENKTRFLATLKEDLRHEGVTVIEPRDALCDRAWCRIYQDGEALYFDRHHLSVAGADMVARLLLSRTSPRPDIVEHDGIVSDSTSRPNAKPLSVTQAPERTWSKTRF